MYQESYFPGWWQELHSNLLKKINSHSTVSKLTSTSKYQKTSQKFESKSSIEKKRLFEAVQHH